MKGRGLKFIFNFIIIGLFLMSYVSISAVTAEIQGSVYDLTLDKVDNVIIEINTKPLQKLVAKNGDYLFKSIPIGEYIIKAYTNDKSLITTENITITQEGSYTIDLFLIPEFGDIPTETIEWPYYLMGILILIIIIYFISRKSKKPISKNSEMPEDLQKVIQIIKNEGGRTTQKDIREKLGLSEAKISLMIVDLENKGVLKRIKKGRGNIIILNK